MSLSKLEVVLVGMMAMDRVRAPWDCLSRAKASSSVLRVTRAFWFLPGGDSHFFTIRMSSVSGRSSVTWRKEAVSVSNSKNSW